MASRSLTSTELANLIAMLSEEGAAPIPRMSGFGPASRSGATQAELLERIRQDLDADLFRGDAYGSRRTSVNDDVIEELQRELKRSQAKATGRGATARRLAEDASKAPKSLVEKGKGFFKGGLGKSLLVGGGTLGGIFMAMEFMRLLSEGQEKEGKSLARASAPAEFAQNLQNSMRPSATSRLNASSEARRLAAMGDRNPIPMSRELQDILATDPNQIFKFRQSTRPASLKEAYARAGLSA